MKEWLEGLWNILLSYISSDVPLITSPTWIFFVVLGIILFAPLLMGKLRIPHVVGLILAGVIVGPYGLNVLARDASFQIFGQVGIYYIMFLAALELDMGSVEKYGRSGLKFGLLSLLIPFFLSLLVSTQLMGLDLYTSLLLSCIYSSHTLVSYPIVGRFGLTHHRAVVVSIVATAFTTFASLLILTFVLDSLKPDTSLLSWIILLARCGAYGLFVLLVFPRVTRWFLRRYSDSVMQFIFVLAMMYLSAALAIMAGMEGLLGAFLGGLIVNRVIPRTSPLMNRLEFVGNALFIPYFLIGVGMLVDIKVLFQDLQTVYMVVGMVITATITKWLPAKLMAKLMGSKGKGETRLMFGLTTAHAAGALAIVMIGVSPSVGLMDARILNITVMMIFFSCIISSMATGSGARILALSETEMEDNRGSYHGRCLVTYSQPEVVESLTQWGMLIRNPYIPDSLMGLSVTLDNPNQKEETAHKRGTQMLENAKKMAAAADVPMATLCRMSTNIASGILHTMREYECGEVIMSLTDRTTGMLRTSLGPVIDDVIEGTHREVMVLRSIVPAGTIRRIVVAVPEKAEYEVGFFKWVEHICRMGEELDCYLQFYAHPSTLPYIRGYMEKKHDKVRTFFNEMTLWGQLLNLQNSTDLNSLLVIVTARRGFISYQKQFKGLPLLIHRYFGHTNIMLLYPDQWGEPSDTLSVFAPNGTAITRSPQSLGSWLKKKWLTWRLTTLWLFLLGGTLTATAQDRAWSKMSPLLQNLAKRQEVAKHTRGQAEEGKTVMVLAKYSSEAVAARYNCQVQKRWGDIRLLLVPLSALDSLAHDPEVERLEANPPSFLHNDTSALITQSYWLSHQPPSERYPVPLTGKGVVLGIVDVGFDLTHPTFLEEDLVTPRVKCLWDLLDTLKNDRLPLGNDYTTPEAIREKQLSRDAFMNFHGTHTLGTAAGTGYLGKYAGMAPQADICAVATVESSNKDLLSKDEQEIYTDAMEMLEFSYILDYAGQQQKPCVISYSMGRPQGFPILNTLGQEVLDSMLGPGRILVASAGNSGYEYTYLAKARTQASACTMLKPSAGGMRAFLIRSWGPASAEITVYDRLRQPIDTIPVHSDRLDQSEEAWVCDTLAFQGETWELAFQAISVEENATDGERTCFMSLSPIDPEGPSTLSMSLSLTGTESREEAVPYIGYFFNDPKAFPGTVDAEKAYSVNFPAALKGVICVGATQHRRSLLSIFGDPISPFYTDDGKNAYFSSIGPSFNGETKPDVVAPGTRIISAMGATYIQENKENYYTQNNVERFLWNGAEYAWGCEDGTSMSTPVVAGIIAQWMQLLPRLTASHVLEALEQTARHPDEALSYPNNTYGYGLIDAQAGLDYLLEKYGDVLHTPLGALPVRIFDLNGHSWPVGTPLPKGIYLIRREDGKVRKQVL